MLNLISRTTMLIRLFRRTFSTRRLEDGEVNDTYDLKTRLFRGKKGPLTL